ncbi:hypothetical protein B0I35DRAFT_417958 [Stachybotrys elegans]|uniref:Secreted protein n=1 Tax=Stachybotrys elegans TaxID=80388 RepID=A0A8K0T3E7_9HYPO|nr:hypothetical protein B0I35DRAFT_417958 [Stachybotrys elegans]
MSSMKLYLYLAILSSSDVASSVANGEGPSRFVIRVLCPGGSHHVLICPPICRAHFLPSFCHFFFRTPMARPGPNETIYRPRTFPLKVRLPQVPTGDSTVPRLYSCVEWHLSGFGCCQYSAGT